MAKALFHRHQRVWVEPVGTYSVIDRINPVWVKGFDEPVKVTYDCGLGREFNAEELRAFDHDADEADDRDKTAVAWRLMRARNKWHSPEDCAHHPSPGSYPVVTTDINGWGGWRVPGAEYDRDPELIELQARLITSAPLLMTLAKRLVDYVKTETADLSADLVRIAKRAQTLIEVIEPNGDLSKLNGNKVSAQG